MSAPREQVAPGRLLGSFTGFFALGMGSGLSPVAPGTIGSLAALPFGYALLQIPDAVFWPLWVGLFIAGAPLCGHVSRRLGAHDPGAIVWDEMVALWAVLALSPPGWGWWLAAFVLFRAFDILKPWPIRALERRVGGGLGIMLDDLLAGVYAVAVLLAAHWAMGV